MCTPFKSIRLTALNWAFCRFINVVTAAQIVTWGCMALTHMFVNFPCLLKQKLILVNNSQPVGESDESTRLLSRRPRLQVSHPAVGRLLCISCFVSSLVGKRIYRCAPFSALGRKISRAHCFVISVFLHGYWSTETFVFSYVYVVSCDCSYSLQKSRSNMPFVE